MSSHDPLRWPVTIGGDEKDSNKKFKYLGKFGSIPTKPEVKEKQSDGFFSNVFGGIGN